MADKLSVEQVKQLLLQNHSPLTIYEINEALPERVAERTLRRWLANAVEQGQVIKIGEKRGTKYQVIRKKKPTDFQFLAGKSESQKTAILKQLRDLWTHTSTALEGNTLTLGDTHFLLEEGLTISGKPIREHQEIIGHASAIELIYQAVGEPVIEQLFFDLHKAVQSEKMFDIDKPYGAWKVQPNGTYVVDKNNKQLYIEYAHPFYVPKLMNQVIDEINRFNQQAVTLENAHSVYAKIHAAIAHIHPFWDGNGRIARLAANLPLLNAGLPPLIIANEKRREYIQLLAQYELAAGKLDSASGAWPDLTLLYDFNEFCLDNYQSTLNILKAFD